MWPDLGALPLTLVAKGAERRWTHPQGCDGGRISKPALLIFQIVAFRPFITLADFPQLHSFICGGQPEETLPYGKGCKGFFFFFLRRSRKIEVVMEGMATEAGPCQRFGCINLMSFEGRAHILKQNHILCGDEVSLTMSC